MKFRSWWFILICFVLFPVTAWGAKSYKIYVINQYGAWDIVCDSYKVQKDDHIWDILRRKGSIAEEDFPRFVEILKGMNPHVKDVDRIYPNQEILIPLKQIPAQEGGTQAGPRYITIPMIPDVLFKQHTVKAGECLSRIVTAHLGVRWPAVPEAYLATLKRLNPKIKDLDVIYAGEEIRIPDTAVPLPGAVVEGVPASEEETLSGAVAVAEEKEALRPDADSALGKGLVDEAAVGGKGARQDMPEEIRKPDLSATAMEVDQQTSQPGAGRPTEIGAQDLSARPLPSGGGALVFPPQSPQIPLAWKEPVSKVLGAVGGKLLATGHCFFPGGGTREDVVLDLAAFPVAELDSGAHLLFESHVVLPEEVQQVMQSSWKDLVVVSADRDAAASVVLEKMFQALLRDRVSGEVVLPVFGDGVRVTLRGDWIVQTPTGPRQELRYVAVTLVEDRQEETSPAVVEYLRKHDVVVSDFPYARDEGGVQQGPATPAGHPGKAIEPRVRMLDGSGQEAFVASLARAIGLFYEPQVPLSFDYAGFHVETRGNLVYGGDRGDVVIDFGTFYGEARSAIEAGGVTVLSVHADDDLPSIAKAVLGALGVPVTENPTLFAANRVMSKATSLTIPGFLIAYGQGQKAFLSPNGMEPDLVGFLDGEGIPVLGISKGPAGSARPEA